VYQTILINDYPFLAGVAGLVAPPLVAALKASSMSLGTGSFNLKATRIVKLSAIDGCA
jgi:hypothetical protein